MEGYVEPYVGQQYVGIDLHRRRSVIGRTTDAGEVLEAVQITNTPLDGMECRALRLGPASSAG